MRETDAIQPTLSDPLRTVSGVTGLDAADARIRIDLMGLVRVSDPDVAQPLAREALDDDPVADLMAEVIQPFAGALVEVIRPVLVWVEEAVETADAPGGPEEVAALLDEMDGRVNTSFAEVFRPNEAMQVLLGMITAMFEPLRAQVIEAAQTGTDPELEMPPVFMDFVWAMADAIERECPENWPRSQWLQAADAVVRHGVPIVGVVPRPTVERVVAAVGPPRLNRHAVMHGGDRHHATLPNAVTACLLAATLFDAQHRAASVEACANEAGR